MIRYTDISLKYGEKSIFENLSLEIDKGEKVVISGKSGIHEYFSLSLSVNGRFSISVYIAAIRWDGPLFSDIKRPCFPI